MNLLVRAWHAGTPSKIHAVRSMLGTIANVIERLSPEYIVFALDGGHDARGALHPGYKADRKPHDQNLVEQIALAQQAISAIGWPLVRAIGWEADDVVASLAHQLKDKSASTVICSSDKDLLQLVGLARVYHPWDTGKHMTRDSVFEKFGVWPSEVADYLALVGDSTDCVPGVKGIGPKKANELIRQFKDLGGILEAARTQRIPGAAGKALREQKDAALMSRQLVELRSDIDIYADWQDWPALEPRAGWVDALRSLDLGQSVQRLCELLPQAGRVRSGDPLIEFQWEHGVIENFSDPMMTKVVRDSAYVSGTDTATNGGADDSALSGLCGDRSDVHRGDSERDGATAVGVVSGDVANDGPRVFEELAGGSSGPHSRVGNLDGKGSGSEEQDTGSETASSGTQAQENKAGQTEVVGGLLVGSDDVPRADNWVDSYPGLGELCDRGASHEDKCRSVYANAIRLMRKNPDRIETGWKSTSDFHFVALLAMQGKPFSMPLTSGLVSAPQPSVSPPATKSTERSLF